MVYIKIVNWKKPGEWLLLDEKDLGKDPRYVRWVEPKEPDQKPLPGLEVIAAETAKTDSIPKSRRRRNRFEQAQASGGQKQAFVDSAAGVDWGGKTQAGEVPDSNWNETGWNENCSGKVKHGGRT